MMKLWRKLRGLGLSWLMILVMFAGSMGLTGCGQVEGGNAELVGQVVSVAADIAIEELLETEESSEPQAIAESADRVESEISTEAQTTNLEPQETGDDIEEDGWYTTKADVARYIHLYHKLPGNFIDKNKAEDLGWQSTKGNLDDVAPGMSIGGNKFGNREGLLPKAKGRTYYECDINYEGGHRGAERIVYSNDGLIYYTEDHYDSFELLYTQEGPAS